MPEVSWLFFQGANEDPYLTDTGRESNAEKQPTGSGPEGCDENGPTAALLVGYVSIETRSLLAPCRRPILIATKYLLFRGQDTRKTIEDDGRPYEEETNSEPGNSNFKRYSRTASFGKMGVPCVWCERRVSSCCFARWAIMSTLRANPKRPVLIVMS